MNLNLEFIVNAIGWTLLHSVWQGAVIGLLFVLSRTILKAGSPVVRHANAVLWLVLFLALFLITFVSLLLSAPASEVAAHSQTAAVALAMSPESMLSSAQAMPLIFALWLSGVLILSYQLVRDWHQLVEVTQTDAAGLPQLDATLDRLSRALQVPAGVRMVEAVHATVPMVVGVLKPIIVIPSSVLLGLTPRELELIIAHELGHLKRKDHLINYLLIAAETLLFFHPVVYVLTRTIRHERELCCDDLVISTFNDRVTYAHALSKLETLRALDLYSVSALQLAAADGPLVTRIARLVRQRHHRNWGLLPTALLPVAAALLVVAVFYKTPMAPTETDVEVAAQTERSEPVAETTRLHPIRLAHYERRSVAPSSVSKITSALTRQLAANLQRPASGNSSTLTTTSQALATSATGNTKPGKSSFGPTKASREPSSQARSATFTPQAQERGISDESPAPIKADAVLAAEPVAAVPPAAVAGAEDDSAEEAFTAQSPQTHSSADNAPRIVYDMTEMALPFAPVATRGAPSEVTSQQDVQKSRFPSEEVSGGDLIFSVTPKYPDRARSRGLVDRVVVSMTVGADGSVNQVSFVNTDSRPMFQRAVKRAVTRWKFEPLLRNGEPVEQTVEQSFNFTLQPYSANRRSSACRDGRRTDCRLTS